MKLTQINRENKIAKLDIRDIANTIAWRLIQTQGCTTCFVDCTWCQHNRVKVSDDDDTNCMLTLYKWFLTGQEEPELSEHDLCEAIVTIKFADNDGPVGVLDSFKRSNRQTNRRE